MFFFFFFSSRRRHTRYWRDWSSDVCSSDLEAIQLGKPVLSVPLRGQFEQVMNARYLQREGFGMCAPVVDAHVLSSFLAGLDTFPDRLGKYAQDGNLEALETILARVTAAAADSRRERARARRAARTKQP